MCHRAQVLKCSQWFLTCSSQNKGPQFLKVKEVTTDFCEQKNSLNFLCTTDMKWTTLKIMFHCFLHSLTDYPSLIYILIYLFTSAFFSFFLSFFVSLFLSFFLSFFIYLLIYLFIYFYEFIYSFIYLFACLFVCLFVYLFIYLFIFFIFFYLLLTNYN